MGGGRVCCSNDVDCTDTGVPSHSPSQPPSSLAGVTMSKGRLPDPGTTSPGCGNVGQENYAVFNNHLSQGSVTIGIYNKDVSIIRWENTV